MTPLIWAAELGRTDSVRVLLQAGAEKDAKNRNVRDVHVRFFLVIRLF